MRLPEAKIKEAILHPDRLVRQCALDYFSGSYSQDPAVMPLAIQALETFGRAKAFRYIHALIDLVQSEATVDWIIRELQRNPEPPEENEDYFYHLSRLLLDADLRLVIPRAEEIVKAPNFHGKSVAEFEERLQLADWDADHCWTELERLCAQGMEKGIVFDFQRGNLIVEALARCGEKFLNRILDLLNYQVKDYQKDSMTWMEIMVVMLAGRIRLERAISTIVKKLRDEGEYLQEECVTALARIGTEEAVSAITDGWPDTTWDYRLFATTVLEKIHTDATVRQCLALLPHEEDLDIKTKLAGALLNQFPLDGVEPVLQMLRAKAFDPQLMDLKSMLVANSTILGTTFPEFAAWKHEDEIKQARIDRNIKAMRSPLQLPPLSPQRPPPPAFTPQPPPDFSQPAPFLRLDKQVGRNDPCPCGSGKKFKKCCLNRKKS